MNTFRLGSMSQNVLSRPTHRFACWSRAARAACGALMLGLGMAQAAPVQKLHIVGGLAGLGQFVGHEEPFWTRELARLSSGKYDADIVPFDRAGVPGGDMLRFIQLGVIPFGTVLMSSMTGQYPEYGAPDLAGLNPDMATLRKTLAAFRPFLEKALRQQHGIEALAIYVYPAQVVFCSKPMASLADLAGRRIRVSSATQSDFVAGFNGIPVLTGFPQLMTSMTSGSTECAITASMSGNILGLHEITTHVHTLPITWGLAVFGANIAAWDALPPDLRSLLRQELPKLEGAIWADSERETANGLACNRGAASCSAGRKGRMLEVAPSGQDERRRTDVFVSAVLPKWLQRCKSDCAEIWNQTIGPVRGIRAAAAKK